MLLILKLTIVPLFIGLVTLAGRRWNSSIAGLLGAFPIVAGPIIVFIAYEQGTEFATSTSVSAISAVTCPIVFGLAYSWSCTRWSWPISIAIALIAWTSNACLMTYINPGIELAITIALCSLLITPALLPKIAFSVLSKARVNDIPIRMLVGALLTFIVTSLAALMGASWSGLLATFPVIGSVLSIFTHITLGPYQVIQFHRGMIRGFYSFVAFFICFSLLLNETPIWLAIVISALAAITTQIIIQWGIKINSKLRTLQNNV